MITRFCQPTHFECLRLNHLNPSFAIQFYLYSIVFFLLLSLSLPLSSTFFLSCVKSWNVLQLKHSVVGFDKFIFSSYIDSIVWFTKRRQHIQLLFFSSLSSPSSSSLECVHDCDWRENNALTRLEWREMSLF